MIRYIPTPAYPEGYYVGRIPAVFENGVMKFTVGTVFPASYYLISAE